jgi:anti-repressor protein
MEDLITITEQDSKQIVSARELYDFLEINTDFTNWCKRMFEYGFEEGKDFTPILGKSSGGRPSMDYALTLDTAKEISMIQRTDKGKQARQYFIACEKQLFTPKVRTHLEVIDSERALLIATENSNGLLLEATIKIEADKPKVVFADSVIGRL